MHWVNLNIKSTNQEVYHILKKRKIATTMRSPLAMFCVNLDCFTNTVSTEPVTILRHEYPSSAA